jgi:hypothetical protein
MPRGKSGVTFNPARRARLGRDASSENQAEAGLERNAGAAGVIGYLWIEVKRARHPDSGSRGRLETHGFGILWSTEVEQIQVKQSISPDAEIRIPGSADVLEEPVFQRRAEIEELRAVRLGNIIPYIRYIVINLIKSLHEHFG